MPIFHYIGGGNWKKVILCFYDEKQMKKTNESH